MATRSLFSPALIILANKEKIDFPLSPLLGHKRAGELTVCSVFAYDGLKNKRCPFIRNRTNENALLEDCRIWQ